ncbi:hypothetical protein FACS1894121_1530 [Bacteroidia bacterium]|nr:hypothetical protein FACS1894121_1530 [Bacteroidia bacterium]
MLKRTCFGMVPVGFKGIHAFFKHLESQRYKIQNRVMIARFSGKTTCPECKGSRLKAEASYVKIDGKSIQELVNMPVEDLKVFFDEIHLTDYQQKVCERILPDIRSRLSFLQEVGLPYLTLNRPSATLSGGESQRINLATSLGSALVGSLYILDEPSIGLHSRDTLRLITVLQKIRDLGNSVIVVEHDEDMIRAANEIIDIGPQAGRLGGEVVFQGTIKTLKSADTLTADYMYGKREIPVPQERRTFTKKITIVGANANNLKNVTVDIPLNVITVVSGVSGSGKSTLIKNILVPAVKKYFDTQTDAPGTYSKLTGDLKSLSGLEFIDQNPIGRSTRSNPVTYLKIWDDVRKLFSDEKVAKAQGFTPAFFSFNIAGRHSTAKMICITGSNGKTTTTLLTHHLLTHGGIDAGLAGNVGYSLAAQVAENAHPVYVVELSSFQLDGMSRFKADIGVLTNITPDHLDRYDYKFENYVASKFRILQNMDAHCLFIHSQDNMVVAEKVWDMKESLLPKKASFTSSIALENGRLIDGIVDVVLGDRAFRIHKDLLPIKGKHNICNAMVAILIAMRMGLSDEAITEGLQTFPQVPHRMETVAIKDGAIYINDSKATNVDATWYALDSIQTQVIWIAGGTDKGNDYTTLYDLVIRKVRVLICMGIDNTKLIESFSNLCPLVDTHSLAEAMAEVQKRVKAGDTVLLSPCCASFDLFKNYEDRGEQFRKSVI